jgi:uncharacterized Zn finger protein (UPF0148 family)
MIVCPKCGYENLDDALYCNLCKEIFRKEKKEPPTKDEITSIHDLPPDVRNILQQQKAEIMSKGKDDFLLTTAGIKKGCMLLAIIGLGILALIILRFFFTIPVK